MPQDISLRIMTLAGDLFYLNMNMSSTIAQVKQKLFEILNIPIHSQAFAYKGRSDFDSSLTLHDINYTDQDFFVLYVMRREKKRSRRIPRYSNLSERNVKSIHLDPTIRPLGVRVPLGMSSNQIRIAQKHQTPTTEPAKLQILVGMGFSESKAARALQASRNDISLATESLLFFPDNEDD